MAILVDGMEVGSFLGMQHEGELIGESFGNYRLTRFIARGSMGEVFEGQHVLLGKRAAVKIASKELTESADGSQRFFNEARAAASLQHPGLTEIYDFGHHDGSAYIVMELLEGETLAECVDRQGRLSAGEALRIGRQIAQAMATAHDSGVIHRDLKPENIVLGAPEGTRVKVIDFSVAKLATGNLLSGRPSSTADGELLGTPAFMAPEQCHGAARVDARADIYSLGCVLFYMLTGRPPFVAEGIGPMLSAHLYDPPIAPASLVPSITPEVDAVVLRLLEKDPDHRPATMREVHALLLEAEQRLYRPSVTVAPLLARPYTGGRDTLATARTRPMVAPRTRVGLGVATMASLALLVGGSHLADGAKSPGEPAPVLQQQLTAAPPALPAPPVQATVVATEAASSVREVVENTRPVVEKAERPKRRAPSRRHVRKPVPVQRGHFAPLAEKSPKPRVEKARPPARVSVKDGALNPFGD